MDWNIQWDTIAGVTVTGMVVVFIALILLIVCVTIMGKIMSSGTQKSDNNKLSTAQTEQTPPAKPAPPIVQAGITGETVAAISAAVACMTDKPVSIKSIERVPTTMKTKSRSVWQLAGITDNTRPF